MFDDPNKALKELQAQLMAAEAPEEDIFAPPGIEEPEEPECFLEEPEEPVSPGEKRRTKSALLLALLLLEVAALFGVLAWWLLW